MKPGDKRKVRKHAFFPTYVEGEWIWFKDYWAFQRCKTIRIDGEVHVPFLFETEESSHLIWDTYDKKLIT